MDIGQHGYSMAMLNPWCPMFHQCPMVSHGNTMEIYGNPMVFHGAQGHTHGVPWKIHGVQWKALGVPWKTQGTPWSIFVREGQSCNNFCPPPPLENCEKDEKMRCTEKKRRFLNS